MSSLSSSSQRGSVFLAIPQELIERSLTFCHPNDVAAFARTCKTAHPLVYGTTDQYLWRSLFLGYPFDNPRRAVTHVRARAGTFDWRGELQRRVAAERWLSSGSDILEDEAIRAFCDVLDQTHPGDSPQAWDELGVQSESHNLQWLARVLKVDERQNAHDVLSRTEQRQDTRIGQLGGRLRAYLALSRDGLAPWMDDMRAPLEPYAIERLKLIRRQSRTDVYSLTKYNVQNSYGPFLPYVPEKKEYPVNWWQVDAIVNVVALNVRDCCRQMFANPTNTVTDSTAPTRPPMGLDATRAYTAPKSLEEPEGDWAGVTGKWRRFVCFMDYRDLFAFNYTTLADGPLNPAFFDQTSFQEATRLITMELYVTSIDQPKPSDPEHIKTYPTIHFAGRSSSSAGNSASLRGTVRMAEDRSIRWSWVYKVTEHEPSIAWSSEAVQLGSIRSAAGVVGTWTGATHDDGELDDPAGPFWMWKVPDDAPSCWYDHHTQ